MTSTDTPTEEAWTNALEPDDVERFGSGRAASMQCILSGFTAETLIHRRDTGASVHRLYRSRLIRDETNDIVWDSGKFRHRGKNEDLTHEAINQQYVLESTFRT